jgi:hypothetical protein
VRSRWCVWVSAFLLAWLPATGKLIAAENTKAEKEIVKPVRNGVQVFTSSRVLIGVLDKEAQVEVLLKTDQWCKVQYTKDNNRFVGWVLKSDLALPENPPPKKEEEAKPENLSVEETSEKLRQLVRVGVGYKASRGEGYDPNRTAAYRGPTEAWRTEIKLNLSGGGTPAKLAVLRHFRKDHAIELFVEKRIIELKEFREIAHPDFRRIILWYIRALQAYNDGKVPDFMRLINSAERFWNVIDAQLEDETPPIMYAPL